MMDEPEVRSLLDVLAREPQPPSRIDVERTVRRRGRRRRARRAMGAGVAAVVLVGGLGTAVVLARTTDRGPATSAPLSFSLHSRYASFGWLPKGFRPTRLDLGTDKQTLTAASGSGQQITLTFVSRSLLPGFVDTWNGKGVSAGPKVEGRPSIWVTEPHPGTTLPPYAANSGTPAAWRQQCQPPEIAITLNSVWPGRILPNPLSLCWEYTRGTWATVTLPSTGVAGDRKATALRIARTVKIGLDQRQRFPFRLHLSGVALAWTGSWVTPTEWTVNVADPRPPHSSRSLNRSLSVSVRLHGTADYNGYANAHDSMLDGYPAYQTGSEDTGEKLKNTLDVYGVHGTDIHLDSAGYTEDELRQIFRAITILGKGEETVRPLG